jgi:hypothetical protein
MLRKLMIALAVCGGICSAATSQSLALRFEDHDGSRAAEATFAVLRTGHLVGSLELPGGPSKLECATAFYTSNGHLMYVSTGEMPTDRAYFVYRGAPLGGDGGRYPVKFPIGTPGAPQLPIGTFTMRLWVAAPGSMTFDAVTGAPDGGSLAVIDTQVAVAGVNFAIHSSNPRNIQAGQIARFRVLTADPVAEDTYLKVFGDDTLGVLGVSQIMIPSGATCSAEFTLEASLGLVEGQIAVVDDSGAEYRSPMLRVVLPSSARLQDGSQGPLPELPAKDKWAWCKFQAKDSPEFGDGQDACGPCGVNPPSHEICRFPSGAMRAWHAKAECAGALTTDCEYFHDNIWVQVISAKGTFAKPCGSTSSEVSGGTVVGGRLGRKNGSNLNGQISEGYQSTTQRPEIMWCCTIKHEGPGYAMVVQCRTIN